MSHIDGEKIWTDKINGLPPTQKDRFHRLTIKLDGDEEPALDDLTQIEALKYQTYSYLLLETDMIHKAAMTLKASLFYIELDGSPEYFDGHYHCSGRVLCQLESGPLSLKRLTDQTIGFVVNDQPISYISRSAISRVANGDGFVHCLEFGVRYLTQSVSIKINALGGSTDGTNISGSPFSMDWIRQRQGLDQQLGRDDPQTNSSRFDVSRKRKRVERQASKCAKARLI